MGKQKLGVNYVGTWKASLETITERKETGPRDTKDGGGRKDWQQRASASLIALRKGNNLEQHCRQRESITTRPRVASYNQHF